MTIDFKTTAFLFPGQGSQTVGMGRDLAATFPAARETFDEADSILGFSLSKLMWEGPDTELNSTVNTQPALFIHSIASFRTFYSIYPETAPLFLAGHSLGELSAIAASGAISFADGLRLVRKRGELMKQAGEQNPGGMAAILGLDIPTLDKVCAQASSDDELVQVANDNCPGQVVISGHKHALERAMGLAKEAGAKRALPLAVSIAAHSPLMDTIQADWNAAIDAASFKTAGIPVVGNVSAGPMTSPDELRADLISQMQSRVRWTELVRLMNNSGVITFIEVGTGTVLGGLVKRIAEGVSTMPLGNPQDFEAFK